MLSFIRNRFPSKDRNIEHIQDEHQKNHQTRKSQSAYGLNVNKKMKTKNKKKEGPLSPTSSQINQSYSDINYFPMMSTDHHQRTQVHYSLTDLYLNPSEDLQRTNQITYVTIPTGKAHEHPRSVSDRVNDQQLPYYKDIDHQLTNALRETIQQRTQQQSFH